MRAALRVLKAIGTAALVVAALAFLAMLLLPRVFSAEIRAVVSGSMEPAIERGALVVAWPVDAHDVGVGDVVMFLDPSDPNRIITHRVSRITSAEPLAFQTKGDANDGPDFWTVTEEHLLGRVTVMVPNAGRVLTWMDSTAGFVGLLVIPSLLLLAGEARLWYRFVRYGNLEGPRAPQSHAGLFEVLIASTDSDAMHQRYGRA